MRNEPEPDPLNRADGGRTRRKKSIHKCDLLGEIARENVSRIHLVLFHALARNYAALVPQNWHDFCGVTFTRVNGHYNHECIDALMNK
jgi:hypothetical protein